MMTMNLSLELHLQQMMNKKNQKTPKLKVRKNRNKRLHQQNQNMVKGRELAALGLRRG